MFAESTLVKCPRCKTTMKVPANTSNMRPEDLAEVIMGMPAVDQCKCLRRQAAIGGGNGGSSTQQCAIL
ncbi:hypothetical protein AMAG_19412 [Allomyces macrogynus ATCC 38327]|uniref:Uncharacterized protein n=1 Tax=Allomyces macrogynus (strain ATCC 38327) TaxID=578462 RepID=A0A0L0SRP4_ALLM3|nr:hypothetical protein AMAG_19412 [Allomyces macrogynus ATCC 38327]|eukprot:KNE65035.1 hypothetical protein AMAG_19412 [Allomyces macrogynus ATCC 38327]